MSGGKRLREREADAPLAVVWFTCQRDGAALLTSVESAHHVVSSASTFYFVVDAHTPIDESSRRHIRAVHPRSCFVTTQLHRDGNLNGAAWVAEELRQMKSALGLNARARYVAKVDSDVVFYQTSFKQLLRPERWVMVGSATNWRGRDWFCWGALYFLHRDFVEHVTSDGDPEGMLHEMNRHFGGRYGEFAEDESVSQLAIHLCGRERVWMQPETVPLVHRWNYEWADEVRDARLFYWHYDAVEYGLVGQICQRYGVDREAAFRIRDRVMRQHLDMSRRPERFSTEDRGFGAARGRGSSRMVTLGKSLDRGILRPAQEPSA